MDTIGAPSSPNQSRIRLFLKEYSGLPYFYHLNEFMQARQFLEDLRQRVPAESLADYAGKIAFDLAGDQGGQYTLVISESGVVIDEGIHDDAHCGLQASYETLTRIIAREENVLMAMMMGKLKVTNQGEMIKYARILGFM